MSRKYENYTIGSVVFVNDYRITKETDSLQKVADEINLYKCKLEQEGIIFDEDLCKNFLHDISAILTAAQAQYKQAHEERYGTRFKFESGVDDIPFTKRITEILSQYKFSVPNPSFYQTKIEFIEGKATVKESAKQQIKDNNTVRLETPLQVDVYRKTLQAAEALYNLMEFTIKHHISDLCQLVGYGGTPSFITIGNGKVEANGMAIDGIKYTKESQQYLGKLEKD